MTREEKSVSQAVLTVFLYGLTSYMTLGESIFPFPLNELIFLIVAIVFVRIHFKENKYLTSITLLMGVFAVLSSQFYWEIVLDSRAMMTLTNGNLLPLFKFIKQLSLLFWIIFTFLREGNRTIKLLGFIPVALVLSAIIWSESILEFVAILLLFCYALFRIKKNQFHYLWVLLFILECTKLWHLVSLH